MLQQQKGKRLGRPLKAPTPGKRVALGLKVTAEIKQRIDEEARRTGRTQSQQAELLIERAISDEEGFGGPKLFGLTRALASVMDAAGRSAAALSDAPSWIDDPWCYDHAVTAASRVLEALRPPGKIQAPAFEHVRLVGRTDVLERMLETIGQGVAGQALFELSSDHPLHTAATGDPAEPVSRRADRMRQRRSDLGPLADRLNKEQDQ
jgi:hypothetical protein